MRGVLFLVQFVNFDRTVGFCLELHIVTLAAPFLCALGVCKGSQFFLICTCTHMKVLSSVVMVFMACGFTSGGFLQKN